MSSLLDLAGDLSAWFWGLPTEARVAIFVVMGITLTIRAIPNFQEEFLTALVYMALAVFFFWMAITPFM
jgi:hypothetical protein